MPINFAAIRPYKNSQNEGFEELVCQLVRRTDAAGQPSWFRLHGAGGDGGVEAFWLPSPTQKTGIQAKYFLKTGDIAWGQITGSFETALRIHRDLNAYRIYIACDLTGPTGRSEGGLELWNKVPAPAHPDQ